MAVIRFLFALLLGFVIGAGTALWLVQSGAGDFMIRRTAVVQDMELKVRDLEQQRDRFTRISRTRRRAPSGWSRRSRISIGVSASRLPSAPPAPPPAPRQDMAAPAQP